MALVVLAVACTSLSQIFQALAARRIPAQASLFTTFSHPLVLLAYASLGLGLLCWLIALTELDVSQTYPLFALGFVATMLMARFGFKEPVSGRAWFGALLIAVGGAICNL